MGVSNTMTEERALDELAATMRALRSLVTNLDGLVTEERARRVKNQQTVEKIMEEDARS